MQQLIAPPDPGAYPDVSMDQYNRFNCARSSTLRDIAAGCTPAQVQYDMYNDTSSSAKGLGEAVHLAVWEPEVFQDCVEIWTDTKTRGKAFHAYRDDLSDSQILLTSEEAAKVTPMVAAIYAHPKASQLLAKVDERESTIIFELEATEDEETIKLLTKARPDGISRELQAVVDLKTTQSAAPRDFVYSLRKYGYHYQGLVYRLACESVDINVGYHLIIAVENKEPYQVALYRVTEQAITTAHADLAPAIVTLAKCYETGEWPAYSPHIVEIGLPEEK